MISKNFTFKDEAGVEVYVYRWLPDEGTPVKGAVQIAHGMAEYALRYERFADFLTKSGFAVYANDHRCHGKTAKNEEKLGCIEEDGFNWMVRDMKQLNGIIRNENTGIPLFLFGHSMGSMLSQSYIYQYGDSIDGVILSGTSGRQGFMLDIGIMIAKNEVKKQGRDTRSEKLNNLTFASYNNSFNPARTEFDWLSRDNAEVDKYVKDPYCGFVCSAGFFQDFLKGLKEIHRKENMARIPKGLPIYLMSGELDPVGKNCKTISSLINDYKKLGIEDVEYKFYKGCRHEMLNETNREEVMEDILQWISKHM